MAKHIVVQRRLHRFAYLAYLIIRIFLCYSLWFIHAIPPLYVSSMSPAPQLNTEDVALAETTEAYGDDWISVISNTLEVGPYSDFSKCDLKRCVLNEWMK